MNEFLRRPELALPSMCRDGARLLVVTLLAIGVIVFPSSTLALDLTDLDGSNGFQINGIDADDYSGSSVSGAGDINGDGIDDVIIGAYMAYPSGESYVVFGNSAGFPLVLDLATLDGSNGFQINGTDPYDLSGMSVSGAGDLNSDGIDDVIIGAYDADPNNVSGAGESYVVYGSSTGFPVTFNLAELDDITGFQINGIEFADYSGRSVSAVGDINGDGGDDLIIGAYRADPNGLYEAGESYVVFGQPSSSPEDE